MKPARWYISVLWLAGLGTGFLWTTSSAAAATQKVQDRSWIKNLKKDHKLGQPDAAGGAISNLPFANGRSFETLDQYLTYLKTYAAPIDQPWYREVRPGVYRLETGVLKPAAAPAIYTREELMRSFGFRE